MENETNTPPEPLAALVAQMRGWAKDGVAVVGTGYIADRIEAAAERERVKARHDAEIEWTRIGYDERKAEERPGNTAALRAALEKFLDFSRRGLAFFTSYRYTEAENDEIEAAFDEAMSALSEPARNCDRFATASKAMHEWERYKMTAPIPPGGWCLGDAFTWLFATAEGGDHA